MMKTYHLGKLPHVSYGVERRERTTDYSEARIHGAAVREHYHLDKLARRPDAEQRKAAAEEKRARKAAKRRSDARMEIVAPYHRAFIDAVADKSVVRMPERIVIGDVIHRVEATFDGVTLSVDTNAERYKEWGRNSGIAVSDRMAADMSDAMRAMPGIRFIDEGESRPVYEQRADGAIYEVMSEATFNSDDRVR